MSSQTPVTRYRFTPFRKSDIVQMCLQENRLPGQEDDFRQLCHMLGSVFHFEFHQVVESLKDSYAPIDPDADTRSIDSNVPTVEHGFMERLNHRPRKTLKLNRACLENTLAEKIASIDWKQAVVDVERFLKPLEQKSLSLWSGRFFNSKLDRLG